MKSSLSGSQSRMEERLDDAIWVLKSHAENPTLRGMPPMGYPAAAYPQGMTEALQVNMSLKFLIRSVGLINLREG